MIVEGLHEIPIDAAACAHFARFAWTRLRGPILDPGF
jgi:hypothetical protein